MVSGGEFEADVRRAQGLQDLARAYGLESTVELSVRFVISKPEVSVALIGFSDLGQLEDALRWVERGPLPEAAVQQVVTSARG